MSECPGCKLAEKDVRTPIKYSHCLSCDARALAQTQEAKDAMLGHPQALQAVMRKLWVNPAQYRDGRVAVYKWWHAINPKE